MLIGDNCMDSIIKDIRFAIRKLLQRPGFTLIAVLTLGLGIGATTAIFSAVNPVLFQPLPYPSANRIVTIWYTGADGSRIEQAFGTYRELAQRSHSFDAMAVTKSWQPHMTGTSEPERLVGQRVSASYFRVLGVTGAGTRFRFKRRSPAWPPRGDHQQRIVAAALCGRQDDCGTPGHT